MRHGWTRVVAVVGVFIALGLAGSCRAGSGPLPDDRLYIRTAPLLLLSRPDVRADLGLTPKQAGDAERAITDLYVRAASLRGKAGAQAVEGRKAIDEAQRLWFEANLTAEQLRRLLQIDLQWEGPSAMVSRPLVADALGLSPDQRAALSRAVARRDAARSRPDYTPAVDKALFQQAHDILTPPQRERWVAMLGQPFRHQLASSGPATPTRR